MMKINKNFQYIVIVAFLLAMFAGGLNNDVVFGELSGNAVGGNLVLNVEEAAAVDVYIGVNRMGEDSDYGVASGSRVYPRYGINDGPVHVISNNGVNIFASQRTKYTDSIGEVLGIPGNQLTTDYWFTTLDDVGAISYLVIGNPTVSTGPALVDVYIRGTKVNATPYSIDPGNRIYPRYGVNDGPVHVVSTNGVDIFTSERTKYADSVGEVLGIPGNQLTTKYWFTTLDDVGGITYLVVGNPETSSGPALVDVYIGNTKMNATPYSIDPGDRIFPRYGINDGPVRVVSTNGVNIFTSQRTRYSDSVYEILGMPENQLTTDYWFTTLDDVGAISYLVIGNPTVSAGPALVDVYIGGLKVNATPYSIDPGERVYPRYGINDGPIHVVSTNGVDIFTSQRTKYTDSVGEVLGIPGNQLTTDYWFTTLDDLGWIDYLVIGNP